MAIYTAATGLHPTLDYAPRAAADRSTQNNYHPVLAGTYTYSLYDGAGAASCQGARIVSAPATAFGSGEVWMLYAMGDRANGFELRPVKLT